MATANPFDLLGDDDNDDPSQLIAAQQQKISTKKAPAPTQAAAQQAQLQKPAKLPTKPLPPAQAVKEARSETGRGGGRGGGRGYGRDRGGGGFNRDSTNNESSFGSMGYSGSQGTPEDTDTSERRGSFGGPRPFRGGGRRGDFSNGDARDGERPRRGFERHSGTGHGNEIKREGAGQGNWGAETDELAQVTEEVNEGEKVVVAEKPSGEEDTTDVNKETKAKETEEKEQEEKEMTLEEYEKVLEEKRKALQAIKTEQRKVDTKEFESMQQLSSKKGGGDDVFIKLGSDKDKRKEFAEKEEKAKKSVSINEFLKPAEGERHYNADGRGRGRGRGRGGRGDFNGGSRGGRGDFNGGNRIRSDAAALAIEDPGQFPTLGAK